MHKLYEKNSIETWMILAAKVRRLDFSQQTEKEFYDNLKKLVKLLDDTEIDLTTGHRNVINKKEIGLSVFLHTIYQMKSIDRSSRGIFFYNKIRELLKLGIKTIEFLPVDFDKEINLEQILKDEKIIMINKAYTDGEFEFCRYGKKIENIKLGNLTNANYILKYNMRKDKNDKLVVIEGNAILRNFNGNYPTIKEVKKDAFPEIDEAPPRYFFDKKPPLSKQIFSVNSSKK